MREKPDGTRLLGRTSASKRKDLGYRLGPRIGAFQWEGAGTRWRQRCREIAEGMPIQVATSACIGCGPSSTLRAHWDLAHYGAPRLCSAAAACSAAMARTALPTSGSGPGCHWVAWIDLAVGAGGVGSRSMGLVSNGIFFVKGVRRRGADHQAVDRAAPVEDRRGRAIQRKVSRQFEEVYAPGMVRRSACRAGGWAASGGADCAASAVAARGGGCRASEGRLFRCCVPPSRDGRRAMACTPVAMCIVRRGDDGCDTLAQYVSCRRMRSVVEAAIGTPSRRMSVSEWIGVLMVSSATQRPQASQRIALASLVARHMACAR